LAWSRSVPCEEVSNSGHELFLDCTLSLVLRGFCRCTIHAGRATSNVSCHFVCLYTTEHLLLEELTISLKSSLSTQSVCYTISPRVGVSFWTQSWNQSPGFFRTGVGEFGVPQLMIPHQKRDS